MTEESSSTPLTERMRRQVERLLDEADEAARNQDWATVRARAQVVLGIDPANGDARTYLSAADRVTASELGASDPPAAPSAASSVAQSSTSAGNSPAPASFCDGRYHVKQFLGEGGKKKVYLATDTLLDRDVAFALIKTAGLDEVGRERVRREAQAMGRLGAHPHVVSVFDLGEEDGQPFIVTELMGGGDVEGLIEQAPGHRVPLDVAIRIADEVCQGLEFAHGKKVVHRDLKPGNVWLTADGTAKLGDFGLAVSLDRTRLTQAGMMVGTVSYMPPEQATGGEVTPRSDLYSLGAMLYELVTGRRPFVGDETVAIITQHLNTPPVAPSWHVPGLPAGLEPLILRLLEKDPAKRPGSAGEVRQFLAGIRPTVTSEGAPARSRTSVTGEAGTAADDPLYGQAFVGREAELKQLRTAFDGAVSGQGALAAVVGEPGIGKTALCEQLATYVAIRGGKTLVGHCYEEGSLSLPYLPFVEALRSYVLDRDPEGLQQDLGSGAVEVARIVSEVRDRVPVEVKPASADPEEDRWRLYQAIAGFLKNASTVQPLLLILEDLHWADRGTLDLLVFLARQLASTRLLIVGNYRDVEVDRAHPLSGALADLRRGAAFLRVPLRGLTADEVQRMMGAIVGQEVSWSLAEAVHRQTEGNPLFAQEVLRYLAEEGLVRREEGHWQRTGPLEDHIPEGLRDVIGKRLSRLSEMANQVLSIASVIGREFRLDVLQRVAGLDEEALVTALEEATSRAVVEQRSAPGTVGFRFTHAFFRQTLYEEIFVPRRIRLHQQVGRALEDIYGRRLDEHAAELAEHFAQSTEPGDLAKALRYSERAAERAMQVFAYAEAVRHLEQALRTQEVLDPDDHARRCDMLLRQAEAMLPLEDPARLAATVAEEAFALAEALGDATRAARIAIIACEAIWRAAYGPNLEAKAAAFQHWAGRADRYAPPGTSDRVHADVYLGIPNLGGLGPVAAGVHLRRAVELAFQLGDRQTVFSATSWALARLDGLRDRALVERLARDLAASPREGVRISTLGEGLRWAAPVLLECGDRTGAERLWTELRELADRSRDATLTVQAEFGLIMGAYLDGRLEESLALAEATADRAREMGVGAGGFDNMAVQARVALAGPAVGDLDFFTAGRPSQAFRALMLTTLGRHAEAQAIRERFGDIGADEDESSRSVLWALFIAAITSNDEPTMRALARRFEPYADQLHAKSWVWSVGHFLGDAAVLLGDAPAALGYYERALAVCAKVRFRPEIATLRLHQAEVELQHVPDQHARAQEHLDFAIEEFRAMHMQPSLERALRHKGLLHA